LGPLYRDVCAAKKGVIQEDCQIASNHEGSYGPQHLAHCWARMQVKESPVKGQHTELGEAHSKVVEVIGCERDLCIACVSNFLKTSTNANNVGAVLSPSTDRRTFESFSDVSYSSITPIWYVRVSQMIKAKASSADTINR
jgi:hypothetical protein